MMQSQDHCAELCQHHILREFAANICRSFTRQLQQQDLVMDSRPLFMKLRFSFFHLPLLVYLSEEIIDNG